MMRFEVGVDDLISIRGASHELTTLHINNFDCIETGYSAIDIVINSGRAYTIRVNVEPKVFVDNLLMRENSEDKINKILE